MAILKVGSKKIQKGVEYTGLVPYGNAIRATEIVGLSINRTPMANTVVGEDILTLSAFTYSFEADTVIWLTRVVQDDLHILWHNKCPSTIDLVQNTESATICSVTTLENTATGKVAASANLFNDNNADEDCTFKIYDDGVEIYSEVKVVVKKSTVNIAVEHTLTAAITSGSLITFTLEADKDMIVEGGVLPSQIQVERIT